MRGADDGLQNCAFKIDAPNLVSLIYCGSVAKEYVLSSFKTLDYAEVLLGEDGGVLREQQIGYGAAVSKFFRALSHVQCLDTYAATIETLSSVDGFVNILSDFHNLDELILRDGNTDDKSILTFFKALPNLKRLVFEEYCIDDNEEEDIWTSHILTTGCMFQQLESVTFVCFDGNARQMRWVELILKNAKALEAVILSRKSDDVKNKVLASELHRFPRASDRCEIKFEKY